MKSLRVILLKPSKYERDSFVQRFEVGLMPNATLSHIASLTPNIVNGHQTSISYIDEYVRTNLDYLGELKKDKSSEVIFAIVGVQSHQFHRAIDLAAYARSIGVEHVVIGGPHPMTCDTSILHDRGVSFSLSEAEVVWHEILEDATRGRLKSIYGKTNRWAISINDVEFKPPPEEEVQHHWVPMVGYYPVRGCPFACSFCSVIKIAGRQVRNPSIDSIISALKVIKKAGIGFVVFTSDNFNKFPLAADLLGAMIDENIGLRFWFQADTQIVEQQNLLELIGRAGGAEMFLGTESFDKTALRGIAKRHNKPETYGEIIRLCREFKIRSHLSNIFGFPGQDLADIRAHMNALLELSPEFASFYVLTPIPGTDQYRDYLERGIIFERNLDRFDASTPTFHHDHLNPVVLQDQIFQAYTEYYTHVMKIHRKKIDRETRNYMVFCRMSASNKCHPMSSGLRTTRLDKSDDYLPFRREVFDVGEHLPLPSNLELSETDTTRNQAAKWSKRS